MKNDGNWSNKITAAGRPHNDFSKIGSGTPADVQKNNSHAAMVAREQTSGNPTRPITRPNAR